ncbi:MAG: FHA domain-containing protein [Victivallales bacterium]|nr:FHA domain-containing protein [Victivallales bacterium]
MSRIVCLSGTNADYECVPPAEGAYEVTFGRSEKNDICVLDRQSSRFHCKIVFSPEGMVLKDSGSTNGVKINHNPVKGAAPLDFGDFIMIGRTVYTVLRGDREQSAPSGDAAEDKSFPRSCRHQAAQGGKCGFEVTDTTILRCLATRQRDVGTGFLIFLARKNSSGNK